MDAGTNDRILFKFCDHGEVFWIKRLSLLMAHFQHRLIPIKLFLCLVFSLQFNIGYNFLSLHEQIAFGLNFRSD